MEYWIIGMMYICNYGEVLGNNLEIVDSEEILT